MRPNLAFASVLALAGALNAQFAINQFPSYDATTEYTSRARVGGQAGFVSQGFPYGISGGILSITRAVQALQDQNPSTQEPWTFGYCYLDKAGAPDYANNNVILSNYRLPLLTQTTPAAWLVTLNLNTAANKVTLKPPAKDMWHYTWNFQNSANWTSDGISVHMSQAATWMGTLLCGTNSNSTAGHREIPRTDKSWNGTQFSASRQILEHQAWSNVAAGPGVSSMERMWRLLLSTNEPVLKAGSDNLAYNALPCPNPNNGGASQDPDVNDTGGGSPGRFDDLSWALAGGPNFANGVSVIVNSQGVLNPGLTLPGLSGTLEVDFLDPLFSFLFVVAPLSGTGTGTFKLPLGGNSSPLRTAVASLPSWSSQAVFFGTGPTGKRAFSNVATIRPQLSPGPAKARFQMSSTVGGTPATITKGPTDRTIFVRNDGPRWDTSTATTTGGWGEITVEQWAGSTHFTALDRTVPARTGMRIQLSPPANQVRVIGKKTVATTFSYLFNY
ncbi:MAG: hypothetical protein ACE5F1_06295 [Planctomycetota bacterium]